MEDQWSPEQIAGRLELKGMEVISHETIYQRILEDKQAGGTLYTHLRCKKKRKKRYGSARSKRGVIPNRVDIDKRPAIVNGRKRTGDWEGDTIIGSHGSVKTQSLLLKYRPLTTIYSSIKKYLGYMLI